jgi:dihydroneopterin aldolase
MGDSINGQTDKIMLKGLAFYGNHGVSPHEKALGQRFIVDVTLECDTRAAGLSDDLTDAVDYVPAYEIVKAVMEGESKNLIESVAEDIAGQILEKLNVGAVSVTIKKPEVAIRGSILSYAGLEIYRRRE